MSKVIVTDMDDVLIHLLPAWLDYLNNKYNTTVKYEDVVEWDMQKAFPSLLPKQIYEPLTEEDLWKSVKPIKESITYLKKLYDEGYTIYVCTSAHYNTIKIKLINALFPNYPFLDYKNIITCHDKSLIKCDYIIDDYHENLKNNDAIKILIDAPYNKNADKLTYDFRAKSFKEVYQIIHEFEQLSEKLSNSWSKMTK